MTKTEQPAAPAAETVTLEPRVFTDFTAAFLAQETDGRDLFEVPDNAGVESMYVLAKTEHQAWTAVAKDVFRSVRKLTAHDLIRLSREQMKPE